MRETKQRSRGLLQKQQNKIEIGKKKLHLEIRGGVFRTFKTPPSYGPESFLKPVKN